MHRYLSSLVLSILLLSGNGWGATYYVNQTGGSNANNGLSTGSAWKTMAKVNASSFAAGDSILFKRGERWRESLYIGASGTIGSPIIFGAYGAGADPIIDGSDIITGWTDNGSNVWKATLTTQPNQVFFNGTRGTHDNTVNGAYKWTWAANVLYVYSTSDADTAFTSPGIEASVRGEVVYAADKSYWNLNHIHTTKSNDPGVTLKANNGVTVQGILWDNCLSDYNYRHGYYIFNDTTGATDNILLIRSVGNYNGHNGFHVVNANTGANRITVDNSTFAYNSSLADQYAVATYSIGGVSKSTKLTVKHCEVYGTYIHLPGVYGAGMEGEGIDFDDNTHDNIAEYNYVHDNGGVGIHAGFGGDNNVVRYNLIVNNGGPGIAGTNRLSTLGANIYNNTIYRDSGIEANGQNKYGIFLFENDAETATYNVKNNIIVGDYEFGVVTNGNVAATCTYNLMYGYRVAAMGGTATCTSSVTSNPLFLSSSDFRLQTGSPAINVGTNVGLTRDFSGNLVPSGSAPDIGAYEYTSSKIPVPPPNIRISP